MGATTQVAEANAGSHVCAGYALLATRPDAAAGKLILWHGAPGTGKTWALRALIREWSDCVAAHYVTDPEQSFGGADSDLIASVTGQRCEWVVPAGTVD